ncbi:hypothetical protein LEP1GSC017_3456 [Leptospira meyeri serovar Hardjo str. Went 5]|nr:hypothetical protein LEP1GSC017_3456 [Leptospira meyeri serovar Hardjo str. Went 5]
MFLFPNQDFPKNILVFRILNKTNRKSLCFQRILNFKYQNKRKLSVFFQDESAINSLFGGINW